MVAGVLGAHSLSMVSLVSASQHGRPIAFPGTVGSSLLPMLSPWPPRPCDPTTTPDSEYGPRSRHVSWRDPKRLEVVALQLYALPLPIDPEYPRKERSQLFVNPLCLLLHRARIKRQDASSFFTSRSFSRSSRTLPLPASFRPRICSTISANLFGIATGSTWLRSPRCLW